MFGINAFLPLCSIKAGHSSFVCIRGFVCKSFHSGIYVYDVCSVSMPFYHSAALTLDIAVLYVLEILCVSRFIPVSTYMTYVRYGVLVTPAQMVLSICFLR